MERLDRGYTLTFVYGLAEPSDSGDVSVALAHQLCMLAGCWHCLQDAVRRDTARDMVAWLLERSFGSALTLD